MSTPNVSGGSADELNKLAIDTYYGERAELRFRHVVVTDEHGDGDRTGGPTAKWSVEAFIRVLDFSEKVRKVRVGSFELVSVVDLEEGDDLAQWLEDAGVDSDIIRGASDDYGDISALVSFHDHTAEQLSKRGFLVVNDISVRAPFVNYPQIIESVIRGIMNGPAVQGVALVLTRPGVWTLSTQRPPKDLEAQITDLGFFTWGDDGAYVYAGEDDPTGDFGFLTEHVTPQGTHDRSGELWQRLLAQGIDPHTLAEGDPAALEEAASRAVLDFQESVLSPIGEQLHRARGHIIAAADYFYRNDPQSLFALEERVMAGPVDPFSPTYMGVIGASLRCIDVWLQAPDIVETHEYLDVARQGATKETLTMSMLDAARAGTALSDIDVLLENVEPKYILHSALVAAAMVLVTVSLERGEDFHVTAQELFDRVGEEPIPDAPA